MTDPVLLCGLPTKAHRLKSREPKSDDQPVGAGIGLHALGLGQVVVTKGERQAIG